ncbi:Crp/Fnr family transcriptional regulator [Ancylomarina sp. 16SWW S1-10-2]|uniref:Crp/Fnr family transcriptional regulator n=1 Tax=Ancylomarina sp. 16SWW S1-10-2 TaxID=2499681 RepID=UPI0012ADE6B7|nr:Crp/Fnr family transcriptional regulator [Ancylomarina sp. 16SWW S1-10-2]MRT94739.1 Crp/Fnr family transcriptional regulator [Ancylomarina sp. 16SWW S1-10-2]
MEESLAIEQYLKHPCFSSLSGPDVSTIINNCTILDFKKNENIIKKGSFATHIHYVLSGLAKINIVSDGRNNTIRTASEFQFLGLSHAFCYKTYHISVTAIESTRVLLIDIEVFKQLIKTNGSFAMSIIETISKTSHRQVKRMAMYTNKRVEGSLATFLLHYARKAESKIFKLPFSRREIAETIGYSRESVIHTFSKFNKANIIKVEDKSVELLDIDLLIQIKEKK